MAEKEGGQKFASPDQAAVDKDGNVFSLQGIDIPERPKSLLEDLKEAQAAAKLDKYGGTIVWVCDEGPERCGHVSEHSGHDEPCHCGERGSSSCCGWYHSHAYLLSELEAGTAETFGDAKAAFRNAQQNGLVPPVDKDWQEWHGK